MLGGPHIMIVVQPNSFMGKNEHDVPAGFVTQGMDVVEQWFRYEGQRQNEAGLRQEKILARGGASYLRAHFPDLDYITGMRLEPATADFG